MSIDSEDRRPLHVFCGHHKCATGWINGILRDLCYRMGWSHLIVNGEQDFRSQGTLSRYVQSKGTDFLSYSNADLDHVSSLPRFRGFHVVRDPRDVVVSGYFSHRYSHPTEGWEELIPHRERLNELSFEDGLLEEFKFSGAFLNLMDSWDYQQDHILEIKMETLTADPEAGFKDIFRHLELVHSEAGGEFGIRCISQWNVLMNRIRNRALIPWPAESLTIPRDRVSESDVGAVLARNNYSRKAGGRKKGEENVRSHYRKGIHGDWKNHFNELHIQTFKDMYNPLLLKLGYEESEDWVSG